VVGRKRTTFRDSDSGRSWLVRLAALLVFLVEIIFVQEAFSPFRTPKMLLALTGIVILAGAAVGVSFLHGKLRFPSGPSTKILLALPVVQAVSSFWAPSPVFSLQAAGASAIWILGVLTLSTAAPDDQRFIWRWALAGGMLSGAILLAQVLRIDAFMLSSYASGNRLGLAGLAGNPADFAIGSLFLLPFLLLKYREKNPGPLQWSLGGFLVVTALLTQNLTALVSIAVLVVFLLARLIRQKEYRVFGGLGILLLALLLFFPLQKRVMKEVQNVSHGNWYALLSGRFDGWSAAMEMVREAPVRGIGAGQFSREFFPARLSWLNQHQRYGDRGEMATHFEWAHNDLLQMQAELGLMGSLWILGLFFFLFREFPGERRLLLVFLMLALPFLLGHYPFHIAVGLLPTMLVLSRILHSGEFREVRPRFPALIVIPVLLCLCVGYSVHNGKLLGLERWRGAAEGGLIHIGDMPLSERAYREAEMAFRRARSFFPHEEAEMGLGLALAFQKRTTEARYYLGRACGINPTLLRLIPDKKLRNAVRKEMPGRRRPQKKTGTPSDTRPSS